MGRDIENWLESGEYLPDFMRDFHDQKNLFKAIQDAVDMRNARDASSYTKDINFVSAQVYTVDFFLWFCARRGYTLQKSRKRLSFESITEWVSAKKREREKAYMQEFTSAKEAQRNVRKNKKTPC